MFKGFTLSMTAQNNNVAYIQQVNVSMLIIDYRVEISGENKFKIFQVSDYTLIIIVITVATTIMK